MKALMISLLQHGLSQGPPPPLEPAGPPPPGLPIDSGVVFVLFVGIIIGLVSFYLASRSANASTTSGS